MRNWRKVWGIGISVAMLMTSVQPLGVLAADGDNNAESAVTVAEAPENTVTVLAKTYLTDGENIAGGHVDNGTEQGVDWMIDVRGKLTVTGTGDFNDSLSDEPVWGEYKDKIKSAVIELQETTNARGMFSGCSNLTSVDLSGFDTSSVTNMDDMFSGCSRLTGLDLSGFDTSSVESMWAMFSDCSQLASLDLREFDMSNVEWMPYMFAGCNRLTSVNFGNICTVNVEHMDHLFSGCSRLTNLDLSGLDTGSVKNMNGMFEGCSKLTNLDLSGFDTSNVEDMGNMFEGCSSLTSLNLSGFETGNVRNMSSMFAGCSKLTSLDVSGFHTDNVGNMENMFRDCSSLTSLDVSGFSAGSVDVFGTTEYMFSGCSGLTSLNLGHLNTGNVQGMIGMFSGCSSLTSLDISGLDTGSVSSMDSMFKGCSSLKSLDLRSFDTSNVGGMAHMFEGCSSLVSLDVRGIDTGNVGNMENMFYGCRNLMSLDLRSFDTGNATDMNHMFCGCSSLAGLDLRSFDTSSVEYMDAMFSGCSSLISLDLSGFVTSHVTGMEGLLSGCNNIESIKTPVFVSLAVNLPRAMYDDQGNEYTRLPKNLSEGIWLYRKYKLSFEANGGTLDVASKIVTKDIAYGELPIPTREEYVFTGWYTAKDAGEKVTSDTICKGDATIYAHWRAEENFISEYTVTNENVNVVRDELKDAGSAALLKELENAENVAALSAIEGTYKEVNSITENAPVSAVDDIAADKIEVTGAALNMDSGEYTLKIDQADNANVANKSKYDQVIAFDMSVVAVQADGTQVDFSQKLDVPVTVTLPIPEQININKVKILHDKGDGTMEEVDARIDKTSRTATFTVTHFSVFAFVDELLAQLGDINSDGEVNAKDRMYLARALAGWDGYTVPGVELADFNGDGEVNAKDRMYLARKLAGWDGYQ